MRSVKSILLYLALSGALASGTNHAQDNAPLAATVAEVPELVGKPDLVINAGNVFPYLTNQTFAADSCEILEGCVQAGNRRLLRFNTESINRGTGDLVLGSPLNNPRFHFDACHGHYHLNGFAAYRLLTADGVIAYGRKIGFCLEDVVHRLPQGRSSKFYDCRNQGIQAGWADVYPAAVPCQWIDITETAPGDYLLEMEVNPNRDLPESNYDNNLVRVPVTIPPTPESPANDNFSNAQLLTGTDSTATNTTAHATREVGEPLPAALTNAVTVWFVWTAPHTGPVSLDLADDAAAGVLSVFTGDHFTNLVAVPPAAVGFAAGSPTTRPQFIARQDVTYHFAVSADGVAAGAFQLHLSQSTPVLQLTAMRALEGGWQFAVTGEAGYSCAVETTTDLRHWLPFTNLVSAGAPLPFAGVDASTVPFRAYRVRVP